MEILKLVINGHQTPVVPREHIMRKVQLTHKMCDKGLWEAVEPGEVTKFNYVEVVAVKGATICSGKVKKTVFYCFNDAEAKHLGGQLMLGDYNERI